MRAAPEPIATSGRLALAATILITSIAVGLGAAPATAASLSGPDPEVDGQSSVALDAQVSPTTLFGRDVEVRLAAVNTTSADAFNLSFSVVLPAAVDYVSGSTRVGDEVSADPTVHRNDDSTVLVWTNRSDLLAGASSALMFSARPNAAVFDVGDTILVAAVAAATSDPRAVPDLDPLTGATVSEGTNEGAASAATRLSPFDLALSEPSVEAELLRGVHDQRTVLTATVTNNLVQPTTDLAITTHLPAGLEFLGCGDVDNSAPGTEEYPGAGRLDEDGAPAMGNVCLPPSSVATVTIDPDGDGSLAAGVHTRLEWDVAALTEGFGNADLVPGGSLAFDLVVAVPLRSNVDAELSDPTANLDNNTGPLTADEQTMTIHGVANGNYAGTLPSTDDAIEVVVAEDVSIHASVSTGTIAQGGASTWTLLVESSEYAAATAPISITDVVPDGLDVVGSSASFTAGLPAAQGDGSTLIGWTFAGFSGNNGTTTITYDTVARSDYRLSAQPVMARDSWTDAVALDTVATVLSSGDGSTSTMPTPDASSVGQMADGPQIGKSVAVPVAADGTCGDGSSLDFDPESAGPFRPGDRVCWRLTVDFPDALDTREVLVEDYLPSGFGYESHALAPSDTLGATAQFVDAVPLLTWNLGDVDAGGQRFDVVVQTIIVGPEIGEPGELKGNLLKVRHRNSAGMVYQHRDDADAVWAEPVVDLSLGVASLDGNAVVGSPSDSVAVESGDIASFVLTVANVGSAAALDVDVRAMLPVGLTCAAVTTISDGGSCDASDGWIEWPAALGLDVSAGDARDLTYDVIVPIGITAGVTLTTGAGVRTYDGITNTGTPFRYVPAQNVDGALVANTTAAGDEASILTPWPTVDVTRTTGVSEPGNSTSSQATIGETVSYSIDVVLPGGTTFYGPAAISDDLGARLDLDTASVNATLDGSALPAGWTVTTTGNEIVLTLADAHVVPTGTAQLVEIDFDAVVTDVGANVRSSRVRNRAQLAWQDDAGSGRSRSGAVSTQIVEPDLSAGIVDDDSDGVLEAGQDVAYTVTVANQPAAQTGTAHDVVVVGSVPAELTVLDSEGNPATDDDLVGDALGRYDAAERTITWTISSLAPGASVAVRYRARAADPIVASTAVTNRVEVTGQSLATAADGGRSADSLHGGPGSGYLAEAASVISAPAITVSRSLSPLTATIGESVDHTVVMVVPAGVVAGDVTIIDDLSPGLRFDELLSYLCGAAAEPCSPDLGVTAVLDGSVDQVGFFVGDLMAPSVEARELTLTYRSHVIDVAAATAGADLASSAVAAHNAADAVVGNPAVLPAASAFDHVSDPTAASVTVVEPAISVDKSVDGQVADADWRRAVPGETLTYTIVVSNDDRAEGGAAHDIVVTDAVDGRLVSFTDLTIDPLVAALDAEHEDGTLSWTVAGPIAPGESVSITYQATVPADWDSSYEVSYGAEVVNRADVESLYGVDAASRAAHVDRGFREYTDVLSDVVLVELDLASIGDRVWFDTDRDRLQDADEIGPEGVIVTVVHYGADGVFGTPDDEAHQTTTGFDGIWTVSSLPGGRLAVLVDRSGLPEGMTPTFEIDHELVHSDAVWVGWLNQNHDVRSADVGFAQPPANTGLGFREGDPVTDSTGNLWVVGLKPDGRAFVRARSPEGVWSAWVQQGTGDWASMTVNTDRAGNVWVAGVKNSGAAYVRTKDITLGVRDGWSQWTQQGSGGWVSMALATDPSGSVWLAGVKADGSAYARVKAPSAQIDAGWSSWVHQGSTVWSALTLATDTAGNVWVSGVSDSGAAFVRRKQAGGDVSAGWSSWARQGGSSGWVSMNISTDSHDNLWLAGVKESGTALVRMKADDPSITNGWSSWHQLGSANSWASMTLTVDDIDTLWVAGVKHSGTAYVAMKCYCAGISEGWSSWWQQGSVNSWHSLTISTDPSNRVVLAGLKLSGTGYLRIKNTDSGVSTGWGLWQQQGSSSGWESFEPHSNAWTGVQPPGTPTLGTTDVEWINPPGWTEATVAVNSSGTIYYC